MIGNIPQLQRAPLAMGDGVENPPPPVIHWDPISRRGDASRPWLAAAHRGRTCFSQSHPAKLWRSTSRASGTPSAVCTQVTADPSNHRPDAPVLLLLGLHVPPIRSGRIRPDTHGHDTAIAELPLARTAWPIYPCATRGPRRRGSVCLWTRRREPSRQPL